MLQRYVEIGDHTRRPGQGRNRATTPIQDFFLRLFTEAKVVTTISGLYLLTEKKQIHFVFLYKENNEGKRGNSREN